MFILKGTFATRILGCVEAETIREEIKKKAFYLKEQKKFKCGYFFTLSTIKRIHCRKIGEPVSFFLYFFFLEIKKACCRPDSIPFCLISCASVGPHNIFFLPSSPLFLSVFFFLILIGISTNFKKSRITFVSS